MISACDTQRLATGKSRRDALPVKVAVSVKSLKKLALEVANRDESCSIRKSLFVNPDWYIFVLQTGHHKCWNADLRFTVHAPHTVSVSCSEQLAHTVNLVPHQNGRITCPRRSLSDSRLRSDENMSSSPP